MSCSRCYALFALLTGSLKCSLSVAADIDDIEVLVISASQQSERWLHSSASVQAAYPYQHSLLTDSAQLLNAFSAIQADSRANFAQDTRISIRGFGSRSAFGIRGIYLQQDGIPLTTPDGQGQLSSVLLDNIARVEVLTGPLAALYGNASGGVISLYSREPVQDKLTFSTDLSDVQRQFQVRADWVTADSQFSASAKQFSSSGTRPHAAAKKQQLQFLSEQLISGNIKLQTRVDYSRDPQLQDPLGLSIDDWQQHASQTDPAASLFDTEKQSRQRQISITLRPVEIPEDWHVSLWSGDRVIEQRLAFTGAATTSAGADIDLTRRFYGMSASYQILQNDEFSLRSGVSAIKNDDNRQGYVNNFGQRGTLRRDQIDSADNYDLYLRFNWQPIERIQVQGGWRYSNLNLTIADHYITSDNPDDSGQKNFDNAALAIGINYSISPTLSWYASAGLGFESPTLAEIAYQRDGAGVNLALDASKNQQWESGIKWQTSQFSASVNYFAIDTRDELVIDNSVGGRTSYRNAAKTSRTGSELHWHWRPSPSFEYQFNAQLLSAQFNTGPEDGKQLPGVAKMQLHGLLTLRPWQDSTEIQLHSQYRSKVYVDDENSNSSPSATTFDLSVRQRRQWQKLQLGYWLMLQNIGDKKYVGSVIINQSNGRVFEPAPGRQLSAGLNISYLW